MRLLPIEHRVQEVRTGCLAACCQMALQYIGLDYSQRRLNQLLGLTPIGVPYSHVTRLTQLGVHVVLHAGNPAQIRQALERNLPAIAFLSTGDLPYWQDVLITR